MEGEGKVMMTGAWTGVVWEDDRCMSVGVRKVRVITTKGCKSFSHPLLPSDGNNFT